MEALTAADLLDAWEQGASVGAHGRALILLGYARPDLPADSLDEVPIAGRDAEILRLRRATFGRRMAAVAPCPACAETLELDLDAATIQPDISADLSPEPIRLSTPRGTVTVRRPTTADLLAAQEVAAAAGSDPMVARRALRDRLVVRGVASAGVVEEETPAETLDPSDLDAAIAAAIEAAEPALDLRLAISCPSCGHAWETTIDVPSFLWIEIVASGQRLADEVAGLAAAYGWREVDVLALTPWRRQLYLDLATG